MGKKEVLSEWSSSEISVAVGNLKGYYITGLEITSLSTLAYNI